MRRFSRSRRISMPRNHYSSFLPNRLYLFFSFSTSPQALYASWREKVRTISFIQKNIRMPLQVRQQGSCGIGQNPIFLRVFVKSRYQRSRDFLSPYSAFWSYKMTLFLRWPSGIFMQTFSSRSTYINTFIVSYWIILRSNRAAIAIRVQKPQPASVKAYVFYFKRAYWSSLTTRRALHLTKRLCLSNLQTYTYIQSRI